MDFLDRATWLLLGAFDVIVSNPPYIPASDKETMHQNVVDFEPHTALFVPNEDAFLFYRAIAEFAKTQLNPGGAIYAEIHENAAEPARAIFASQGFQTELRKDMQGKNRMLKASRPLQ